jgi:hypothetical protein
MKNCFGSQTVSMSRLKALQAILMRGIESYLVDAIEETVWENLFISALASNFIFDQNIIKL